MSFQTSPIPDYNTMALFNTHTGSWGLPELGITEALQSWMFPKAAYSAEGGSDIFGSSTNTGATSGATPVPTPPGSTLGSTSSVGGAYPQSLPSSGGSMSAPSGPQPAPTPSQPSGPSAEEQLLNQQRSEADSYYNNIMSGLDRIAGLADQGKGEWQGRVESLFGSQMGDIQAEQEGAVNRIGQYQQDVRTNQAKTLRDLSQNMRNMLDAGQMKLGAYGAGSSSAVPMYAFALAKQANRSRADVQGQSQGMLTELDQKREDVIGTYRQQKSQLEQWKADSLTQVSNWYQQQVQAIEAQRGAAAENKMQLRNNVLQQALSYLTQLDSQAKGWDQTMQQWATQRVSQLNDYKAQLGQLGSYNPQQLAAQEMQAGLGNLQGSTNQDFASYNPYAQKKRQVEEGINSWF